jgi:hypothetical protein
LRNDKEYRNVINFIGALMPFIIKS